jgi:hypothetical protein
VVTALQALLAPGDFPRAVDTNLVEVYAGLPRRELSGNGREAQSRAFFS